MKFIWSSSGFDVGKCNVIDCAQEFEIHCQCSQLEKLIEEWHKCLVNDDCEAIPEVPEMQSLLGAFNHTATRLPRGGLFWHLFVPKV